MEDFVVVAEVNNMIGIRERFMLMINKISKVYFIIKVIGLIFIMSILSIGKKRFLHGID